MCLMRNGLLNNNLQLDEFKIDLTTTKKEEKELMPCTIYLFVELVLMRDLTN